MTLCYRTRTPATLVLSTYIRYFTSLLSSLNYSNILFKMETLRDIKFLDSRIFPIFSHYTASSKVGRNYYSISVLHNVKAINKIAFSNVQFINTIIFDMFSSKTILVFFFYSKLFLYFPWLHMSPNYTACIHPHRTTL